MILLIHLFSQLITSQTTWSPLSPAVENMPRKADRSGIIAANIPEQLRYRPNCASFIGALNSHQLVL